jgi:4-aminobutyrate aminotransferase-like enzyme
MEKGARFLAGLHVLKDKYPQIGNVDGLGLALRMEMCEADGFTPNRALTDKLFQIGLGGNLDLGKGVVGLVLNVGGYYKNVITIVPSLEITHEEIDQALHALDVVLSIGTRD